jgi:nanoRNase/pAp phosphatase (c-di-AMP/oligoRNAs hydrolase)
LTFSATSGATPNDLQVTVNASSLATGIYTGTLTFQTTGANPQTLTAPYSVQVVGLPQRNVYLPLIVR